MEDEDDYMSDKFLVAAESETAGKAKRKRTAVPEKPKPLRQLEKDQRDEGLAKEIGEENKGFKLLKMMGYQ
jgi:hypothetical protein